MSTIPRWKVQAALRLLGLDPDDALDVSLAVADSEVVMQRAGSDFFRITDEVEDTRLHVLGIDPETGEAELNPVEDGDVKFFTGAGMYLAGGSKHANGTLCPIFKRAD